MDNIMKQKDPKPGICSCFVECVYIEYCILCHLKGHMFMKCEVVR